MDLFSFSPIGTISSCYKEKFGIPRQPGLAKTARSQLFLTAEFAEESVRGLEGFSHLWVNFVFHATKNQGWKQMVRPPRLGGNTKVGVFASRTTFRPNALGLSVVKLEKIEVKKSNVILHLLGGDLLDKTPVLDIKPYLPYVDNIIDARGGYAKLSPEISWELEFTKQARSDCLNSSERLNQDIELLVRETLQLDPRPSYQVLDINRVYSMKLYDFDLKWQYCENDKIKVIGLIYLDKS